MRPTTRGNARLALIISALSLLSPLSSQGFTLLKADLRSSTEPWKLEISLLRSDGKPNFSKPLLTWEKLEGLDVEQTSIRPLEGGTELAIDISFIPPPSGSLAFPSLKIVWGDAAISLPAMEKSAMRNLSSPLPPPPLSPLENFEKWWDALPGSAKAASFVGRAEVNASFDGNSAREGEPLFLRVTIKGRGAFLKARAPRFHFPGLEPTKLRGPLRKPAWEGSLNEGSGSLTFEWTIIPHAGEVTIDFDPYSLWDLETGQTTNLQLRPLQIASEPSTPGTELGSNGTELPDSRYQGNSLKNRLSPLSGHSLPLTLLIFGTILTGAGSLTFLSLALVILRRGRRLDGLRSLLLAGILLTVSLAFFGAGTELGRAGRDRIALPAGTELYEIPDIHAESFALGPGTELAHTLERGIDDGEGGRWTLYALGDGRRVWMREE